MTAITGRDYSALTRDELEARLNAAEDVAALLLGWTGVGNITERSMALHELWVAWVTAGGSSEREANPHLTDELIARLAARRDATRAATLARLADRGQR